MCLSYPGQTGSHITYYGLKEAMCEGETVKEKEKHPHHKSGTYITVKLHGSGT